MPGNEKKIIEFLLQEKGSIRLPGLGLVTNIDNPTESGLRQPITDSDSIESGNARKKADVYLNGTGVSIKQEGSSFLFNRLQRADLKRLFSLVGLDDVESSIKNFDQLIFDYHRGKITRNVHWSKLLNRAKFEKLLRYLMMQGSPNYGDSEHPAELILTGPKTNISAIKLKVVNFDDFLSAHEKRIHFTIRRQWLGQSSKSEHRRAKSLVSKPENVPWVFKDISGQPRGWLPESEFPAFNRRTVYMVYIELLDEIGVS